MPRCREAESRLRTGPAQPCRIVSTLHGPVAQRLEQSAHNRSVGGSIPSGPTTMLLVSSRG